MTSFKTWTVVRTWIELPVGTLGSWVRFVDEQTSHMVLLMQYKYWRTREERRSVQARWHLAFWRGTRSWKLLPPEKLSRFMIHHTIWSARAWGRRSLFLQDYCHRTITAYTIWNLSLLLFSSAVHSQMTQLPESTTNSCELCMCGVTSTTGLFVPQDHIHEKSFPRSHLWENKIK